MQIRFYYGLINTGDEKLIRGVAAHEIGHEVLGHADKRKAAIATEQLTRTALSFIPGVGGLIASNAVLVTGMLALPAYSRSQETDADNKAVEILSKANDPDPAGTMAYSFRFLLKASGATGGGLLDSHPNTKDRLEATEKLGNIRPTKALPQAAPAADVSTDERK
jgi:Zn-dependent protease with chaperone function